MKYTAVSAALVAIAAAQQLEGVDLDNGMTREQAGHKIVPGGIAPEMQELKPRFEDYAPGAKRTKVRYGKYTLPKISSFSLMSLLTGEKGTMSTVAVGMKKPCADYCNLISAQASLEYANGTEATVDNGSWLHHIVMVTTGPNRKDTTCPYIPGERFFSSGNEKTPTIFGDILKKNVKSVYPIGPSDTFSAQLELMNMEDVAKDVYLTVDFEYMPGKKPADWKVAKAAWLDVTNCGISYVIPPKEQKFTLQSKGWTSQYDGEMLGVGGHLHDGGINLQIMKNKDVICDSVAQYSKPGEGGGMMAGPPGGHSHGRRDGPHGGGPDPVHIKKMTVCSMMGPIKKGDNIHIEANYDYTKFPGLKSGEVMGIAIMYSAMDMPSPAESNGAASAPSKGLASLFGAKAASPAVKPASAPRGLSGLSKSQKW